jgi:hypothetical protein
MYVYNILIVILTLFLVLEARIRNLQPTALQIIIKRFWSDFRKVYDSLSLTIDSLIVHRASSIEENSSPILIMTAIKYE